MHALIKHSTNQAKYLPRPSYFLQWPVLLALLCMLLLTACADNVSNTPNPKIQVSENLNEQLPLPNGERWLTHTINGLAPYWMMESAQGSPQGNFPTFRCDDGSVLDPNNVCKELRHGWMQEHYNRDYTRMKSRQTYAYATLFHLTGDLDALALAKAGAYYLLNELRDHDNGGFYSYLTTTATSDTPNEQSTPYPDESWQQRTTQDQAYALVGLAMYYYVTRDANIEQALIEQQAFIFDRYRDIKNNELFWVLADGDGHLATQRELVSQLDQINGYMLLVTPLLSDKAKATWSEDLSWLTRQMINNYYNADENRFYGAVHTEQAKQQNSRHNDFGHTVKGFWMTYLVGKTLENPDFIELGEQGMRATVTAAAYPQPLNKIGRPMSDALYAEWKPLNHIPSWMSRPNNFNISSWEWAELDQAAMTINMIDKSQTNQLYYTQRYFMDAWVDHEYGGVGLNPKSSKAFHWGNAYHQFEHALVGYISAQQYIDEPVTLHYAIPEALLSSAQIKPYYFNGHVRKIETTQRRDIEGQPLQIQTVVFDDVSP